MQDISEQGVTITIGYETPRSHMIESTLARKASQWYAELAQGNGLDPLDMDMAVYRFVQLSARVVNVAGEMDFTFATAKDSASEIREKFIRYFDTRFFALIIKVENAIRELDAPYDPAQLPLPENAPKN